jgi:hypothetical protein
VEATFHLQNESVGRYEVYARRKALCTKGEALEFLGDDGLLPNGVLPDRLLVAGLLDRGPHEVHADPELR